MPATSLAPKNQHLSTVSVLFPSTLIFIVELTMTNTLQSRRIWHTNNENKLSDKFQLNFYRICNVLILSRKKLSTIQALQK